MARLLRLSDYYRAIQQDNLAQIVESNYTILLDVEQAAQAEMISYLDQRYITATIFSDTKEFDITATYNAKQLVEYTEPDFSALTIYIIDDRIVYSGNIYKSIAGSSAHAFNIAEWTLICADKALFYVAIPNPEYSFTIAYTAGTLVWYNNIVYTCLQPNSGVLPTNTYFWSAGSAYTVSGVYPDDITKWSSGDNRNQQIVMYLIDVTLYHAHARINPRNIPELRRDRYDGNRESQTLGAIGWLKMVAAGKINAGLQEIIPESGLSITWGNSDGNNLRTINSY